MRRGEDSTIVCSDYEVPPGYVAVAVRDADPYGRDFRLVLVEEAPVQAIISCHRCQRPGVLIDHFYPWLTDHCLCLKHSQPAQKPKRPKVGKRAHREAGA